MTAVVAWLDAGSRVGICPRCITSPQARNPVANDLVPAGAEHARGKACAICNVALAPSPHTVEEDAELTLDIARAETWS